MEVRQLQVNDIFTFARIIGKVTKVTRAELATKLAAKNPNPTEIGLILFQSIFPEAEEDVKSWLADLAGKDKAEFGTMPATALPDVIESLARQEGMRDFLSRVSQLVGKTKTE